MDVTNDIGWQLTLFDQMPSPTIIWNSGFAAAAMLGSPIYRRSSLIAKVDYCFFYDPIEQLMMNIYCINSQYRLNTTMEYYTAKPD